MFDKFDSVDYIGGDAAFYLYALLAQREPNESIAHKTLPSVADHIAFVESEPYAAWYLIPVGGRYVGAIYLTKQREIGISIFKEHRRKGYAKRAVEKLMALHPGGFYANINPANVASTMLFRSFGFVHIQNTYRL